MDRNIITNYATIDKIGTIIYLHPEFVLFHENTLFECLIQSIDTSAPHLPVTNLSSSH
ncbi:hypothetical protein ACKUB1_11215 [Methanospirillum stamsii]|uniref:hypothetical protein n=1 Tax=Methanospirillum stamsii TaxID=1277351 RepID=UPI0015E8765D|nr:hypothetical protein [Methanospirillum stamsii]